MDFTVHDKWEKSNYLRIPGILFCMTILAIWLFHLCFVRSLLNWVRFCFCHPAVFVEQFNKDIFWFKSICFIQWYFFYFKYILSFWKNIKFCMNLISGFWGSLAKQINQVIINEDIWRNTNKLVFFPFFAHTTLWSHNQICRILTTSSPLLNVVLLFFELLVFSLLSSLFHYSLWRKNEVLREPIIVFYIPACKIVLRWAD